MPAKLHYHAPLLGFVGDELAKIGRRSRKHCAANAGKPCFHLGIDEEGVDLLFELVDAGVFLGTRMPHHALASLRVGGESCPRIALHSGRKAVKS
jgi:hypothetical protein